MDLEVARYALRTWKISYFHDRLQSIYVQGSFWDNGVCRARCYRRAISGGIMRAIPSGHQAPHENCNCGVYGSLSLDHLERQYGQYANWVVGVIAAEGPTIIGPRGLRTSFARVVACWTLDVPTFHDIVTNSFGDVPRYDNQSDMLDHFHLPMRNNVNSRYANNYEYWNGSKNAR